MDRPANLVHLHHGGDLGDTIYALPALRRLANPAHLILYPNHGVTRALMDENNANNLIPLLNVQNGITSEWRPTHDSEGLRLDFAVRRFYRNEMNLADMYSNWIGHDHWPREHPWLISDGAGLHNYKIVCARSARYRSNRIRWKELHAQFKGRAAFIGVPWEHHNFEEEIGKIDYVQTPSFLEAARLIMGADIFIGNQSAPRALAEALKIPIIVEQGWPTNTHFGRECAWYPDGELGPDLADDNLKNYWCRAASRRALDRSMHSQEHLETLAHLCYRARKVAGDAIEVGVGKGGSAAVIAWCLQRHVHLCDEYFQLHREEVDGTLKDVFGFLRVYKYSFNFGKFPAEIPENKTFAFVHIDLGTMQDIENIFDWCVSRLANGGVVAFSGYPYKALQSVIPPAKELSATVSYYIKS